MTTFDVKAVSLQPSMPAIDGFGAILSNLADAIAAAQTADEHYHELRRSAKKLRYMLECFGDLAPKSAMKAFVRRLKVIQDSLGEHQDVVVHAAQIDAAARAVHQGGASFETMLAVGQLVEQLNQRHLNARARFVKQFASYDSKATRGALDAVIDDVSG